MRVLLVDDDLKVRAAIRLMLERAGFEVAESGDGDEALRAVRRQSVDVVLCDVFMPNRGGLDVLRDLRREKSDVKVVAMSGGGDFHGTVDLLPLARHLGAVGILYKPFDQAAALAAIQEVVEPATAP